ncbi:SdpI family protein [Methanoregula sp.]|uniref:SdpI family protein n=1 Tax=Methanoregula sp. TaxID=2052170 RepID=UPI00237622F1|nr:SdpI family protein [Methanoregula sp.]MDD1687540.1 SdpI family protein [Methanoregula sp.]
MAQIATHIWNAMGWCPMEASIQYPVKNSAGDAQKKAASGDSGPVARRSARFMRLAWGVVILSWLVAFLVLPHLPEVVPVHWDLNGEANGFSDRLTGTFMLPVFITFMTILFIVLPRFDSMQFTLEAFRDIYAIIIFATLSMLFGLEVIALLVAAGTDLPLVSLISALIGFLFIVMGSLMPHIGRNTTLGIRLPWTLASEEVWKKTHEHGGPVFVVAGVLVVLGSIVAGIWAIALMLVVVIAATLYIGVWSYRLAKAETAMRENRVHSTD